VNATQPNQAYFMLGYPTAFLGKLFTATNDSQYVDTAKEYLEFLLGCQGNLRTFHYSHKVAWGAAILGKITKDAHYMELAKSIANYLVQTQSPDGRWLPDQPAYTFFDQTAEIAIWMREISSEFQRV
jgi:rhamnogalacturonyl hydrolase YesR